jgi:hypothetical protein
MTSLEVSYHWTNIGASPRHARDWQFAQASFLPEVESLDLTALSLTDGNIECYQPASEMFGIRS